MNPKKCEVGEWGESFKFHVGECNQKNDNTVLARYADKNENVSIPFAGHRGRIQHLTARNAENT